MWNLIYYKYLSYVNVTSQESQFIYDLSNNFINYIQTEYRTKFLFRRPLDGHVIQSEFVKLYPHVPYDIAIKCFDFINMYIFLCPFNIIGLSYISYGGKLLTNDVYLNNIMLDDYTYFEIVDNLGFLNNIKKDMESFNILFYDKFLDNYLGVSNLLMSYDSVYNGFPTNLENDLRYTEIQPILDKTYRDTWQSYIAKIYKFLDLLDTALIEECNMNHLYFQPDSIVTLDDYEEYTRLNYHIYDSIQGQAYDLSSYINVLPEHRALAAEYIGNYISTVLSAMFPDVSPAPTDDDPALQTKDNRVFIYSLKDMLYDARTLHTTSGSSYSNALAPNLLEVLINVIAPRTINGKIFVESVQWEDFIEVVNNVITYYFIMILAHSIAKYAKFDKNHITSRLVAYMHSLLFREGVQNGRIYY